MNTRRNFLKSVSILSAGLAVSGTKPLVANMPVDKENLHTKRKIYIFSKHLQWLDFENMAQTSRQIGFDGVDLTVRPNGHVIPERVKVDLPKAIHALKSNGLLANRMTTAITNPDDPLTIDILKTASELGMTQYRMGWFSYDKALSIRKNLEDCKTKLLKLADLNQKYGMQASYQNHSGEKVGGPIWDIGMMIDGVDNEYLGVRYDVRHATVEGGQSWPVSLKYIADRINSLDIKDFVWEKKNGQWKPYSVPLGEGMVDYKRYFQLINELSIKGDFTIHIEYPVGGAENGLEKLTGSPDKVLNAMKHDLLILKNMM